MDNDTNKKICARCGKEECGRCVEEDGKSFCCRACCDAHKKEEGERKSAEGGSQPEADASQEHASGGKDEPANVCRFC